MADNEQQTEEKAGLTIAERFAAHRAARAEMIAKQAEQVTEKALKDPETQEQINKNNGNAKVTVTGHTGGLNGETTVDDITVTKYEHDRSTEPAPNTPKEDQFGSTVTLDGACKGKLSGEWKNTADANERAIKVADNEPDPFAAVDNAFDAIDQNWDNAGQKITDQTCKI